jgi:nucleotide-binding universal stress UspA family protein
MRNRREFVVLVATDGSPEARAAVAATVAFPWPSGTRVRGLVARRQLATFQRPEYVVEAFDRTFQHVAASAQRRLARRWPDATVAVADQWAVDAILSHARRLRARVIVLGSRRRGMVARLVLGSVSRHVVRLAPCAVLIVRGRPRPVMRVVVGVDGSANSHRAVVLVASLKPPRGARVTLVRVVEPLRSPSIALAPSSVRMAIRQEAAAQNADAIRKAKRELDMLAPQLKRSGWNVQSRVRVGHPVPELLRAVSQARAQLVSIGARGIGGVDRLLFGSVAEAVLNRATTVSILVVK